MAASVVLFGPQMTEIDAHRLSRIRIALSTSAFLKDLYGAILRFVDFGKRLEVSDTERESVGVVKSSSFLAGWMKGNDSEILDALDYHPNALLAPLIVINQILLLVQTWDSGFPTVNGTSTTLETKFEGLCIGQLAATAVRLSSNREDLTRFSLIVVRLAFCIGVYVDLDRNRLDDEKRPRCFAVSYHDNTSDELHVIQNIIAESNTVRVISVSE